MEWQKPQINSYGEEELMKVLKSKSTGLMTYCVNDSPIESRRAKCRTTRNRKRGNGKNMGEQSEKTKEVSKENEQRKEVQ
jgi:hypothetical protein